MFEDEKIKSSPEISSVAGIPRITDPKDTSPYL